MSRENDTDIYYLQKNVGELKKSLNLMRDRELVRARDEAIKEVKDSILDSFSLKVNSVKCEVVVFSPMDRDILEVIVKMDFNGTPHKFSKEFDKTDLYCGGGSFTGKNHIVGIITREFMDMIGIEIFKGFEKINI